MATMTYYVALAFKRSERAATSLRASRKKRAVQTKRSAWLTLWRQTEGHCGAIAFSRTGDPALGDFEDAVILKAVGEVDSGLLTG